MATIPAATALAMLPAAAINYFPQYVISSVGADAPTVGPLLEAFTKAGGGTATEAAEATGLLNGVITASYFAPESDTSNAWVKTETTLLKKYAPSVWAKYGLDGNTGYGVALVYTFVQALQAAGKNLTRQSLVAAIEKSGSTFITPGFVPPSYSKTVHYGLQGEEVTELSASAPKAKTPSGDWIGVKVLTKVEVTNAGAGPIKVYTGKVSTPPSSLTSSL